MYQTIARGISLLFLHVQAAAPVLTRCDMRDYAEAAVEVSDIIEAAAPRDLRYAHVAAAEIVHCKLYPLAGDIRPDGYAVEAFENVREIATAHSGVAGYLIKAQLIAQMVVDVAHCLVYPGAARTRFGGCSGDKAAILPAEQTEDKHQFRLHYERIAGFAVHSFLVHLAEQGKDPFCRRVCAGQEIVEGAVMVQKYM